MFELFGYYLQGGLIDVGFLGAAQIDRFGNINTTVIGDYDAPDDAAAGLRRRLRDRDQRPPGVRDHAPEPRAASSRRSTSGRRPATSAAPSRPSGSGARAAGSGAARRVVVTDLGIYHFDDDGEMRLDSLHPGATLEAGARDDRLGARDRAGPRRDAAADRRRAAPDPRGARSGRRLHEVAGRPGPSGESRMTPGRWRAPPRASGRCRRRARSRPIRHPLPRRLDDVQPVPGRSRRRSAARVFMRSGREAIQTGRLLAALSTALDLTEGQLAGHSLRTCYLAMRLADALGPRRGATARRSSSRRSSRTPAAHRTPRRSPGSSASTTSRSRAARRRSSARSSPTRPSRSATCRRPSRSRCGCAGSSRSASAGDASAAVEQIRCERGAAIARKAGFGDAVGDAIHDVHEHWDGGGNPRGLRGAAIDPLARILAACQGLDVFVSTPRPGRGAARSSPSGAAPGTTRRSPARSSTRRRAACSTTWRPRTSSGGRCRSSPTA